MTLLRLHYRTADGELLYCRIEPWSDLGHSVRGFDHSSGRFGVYQKALIAEYLLHSPADAIVAPAPIAPPPPGQPPPPEPGGPPSPLPPHPFD